MSSFRESEFVEDNHISSNDNPCASTAAVGFDGVQRFGAVISSIGATEEQEGSCRETSQQSTVSIHCSPLNEDEEMLINTIEVSTEELISTGQISSDDIELIYSPNIEFQSDSIPVSSEEEHRNVVCGIGEVEQNQVMQELEETVQSGVLGKSPRLVANQEAEVSKDKDAISKAILQAATHILQDFPKTSAGKSLKLSKLATSVRGKTGAGTGISISAKNDVVITNIQGACKNNPVLRPMDDLVLNTIDGKRVTLCPDSQILRPSVSESNASSLNQNTDVRNVILSPADFQGLCNFTESQLPSIIEAATAAHQTVAAALNAQSVGPAGATSVVTSAGPSLLKFETIQMDGSGCAPIQLQKFYCQSGLCRVCLLVQENLTSIFEDITVDSNGMVENSRGPNASHKFNILAALKTLLDVEVDYNDGLPDKICTDCYDQLMDFSVYRKRIALGQDKLNQILEQVKGTKTPTFIPSLGELDIQKTDIYRHPSSINTAKNTLQLSQYSHLVLRNLSDRIWDKIFSSMSTIVGYKSGKLRNLEHYALESPFVKGFFCYACNSTIHGTKIEFGQHYDEFHGVKCLEDVQCPCDICGNTYPLKDSSSKSPSYSEHWLQHFFLYECTLCSKKLPSPKGLWVHKKSAHGTRGKVFSCNGEGCRKSFSKKPHLDAHKRMHSNPKGSQDGRRSYENRLNNSEEMLHETSIIGSDKPLKCHACQKSCKTKEFQRGHGSLQMASTSNQVCECGDVFQSQSQPSGEIQILLHQGEKHHHCTVCSKEFVSMHTYKSHMLRHQDGSDFPCSDCGKIFKRTAYLDEHMRTHTGEKPFKCQICGKSIRMKSNYFKHLRIHKVKDDNV